MVTRSIEGAQKKVEGRNFDQRKNVLEYDDVMNQQRKAIYALRRQVLEGKYVPELSEDEQKKGLPPPEPVTSSGDWTIESVSAELREKDDKRPGIPELIEKVKEVVKTRDDQARETGTPPQDTRPGWRVLRAELWRQYGSLLDLEKRYDGDAKELEDYAV